MGMPRMGVFIRVLLLVLRSIAFRAPLPLLTRITLRPNMITLASIPSLRYASRTQLALLYLMVAVPTNKG